MGRNAIIKTDGSLDYDKIGRFDDQIGILFSSVGVSVESYPRIAPETDDTGRWQRTVDYSVQNGYIPIIAPKQYTISNTILFPQSFQQPLILGRGYKTSKINYANMPAGKAAFKVKGGSGQLSGGMIFGVEFNGNANSIGVELADVCGFKVKQCRFGLNLVGGLFHNESTGGFTEYNVFEDCDFSDTCKRVIEYRITAGNDSFHGSGVKGCTAVQSATETETKILINAGCFPYHAPLDIHFWTNTTTSLIKNNSVKNPTFKGVVTIEPSPVAPINIGDTSGQIIYLVGHVMTVNEMTRLGSLMLCERVQNNSDGSITYQRKPFSENYPLTTGSNAVSFVDNNITALLNVRIYGSNYEYSYLLSVYCDMESGNGSVVVLAPHRSFNVAGYADTTFSFSNHKLVITNATFPASGVTAILQGINLGGRSQNQLL